MGRRPRAPAADSSTPADLGMRGPAPRRAGMTGSGCREHGAGPPPSDRAASTSLQPGPPPPDSPRLRPPKPSDSTQSCRDSAAVALYDPVCPDRCRSCPFGLNKMALAASSQVSHMQPNW